MFLACFISGAALGLDTSHETLNKRFFRRGQVAKHAAHVPERLSERLSFSIK